MRRTIIALLLLVSGAAAAVAQPAKQNRSARTGHCDVGVVSSIEEIFTVRVVEWHTTIDEVPVDSWHLNDLVVAKIKGALGGRAVAQRIPYRRQVVAPPYDKSAQSREDVRRLATGMRCARYIWVTSGSEYRETGDLVGLGIGIEKGFHHFGLVHNLGVVHVLMTVGIYDGETFTPLKIKGTPLPIGYHKVDESFWPDPPKSAAQNVKLGALVRKLVAQELDAVLPDLLLMK